MSKAHNTALVWLRRDLRLSDNPALHHALHSARHVIPIYIHAPNEDAEWSAGAASHWWLHHSLKQLQARLKQLGSRLIIRRGASLFVLQKLIAETEASLVCWNRLYEPASVARDTKIKSELAESGIEVSSHNGALLLEPWQVRNRQGKPFRVFTPFWRECQQQLATHSPAPLAEPIRLTKVAASLPSDALDDLQLLPRIAWDASFTPRWSPGELNAQLVAEQFATTLVQRYAAQRDFPAQRQTSSLSPHLHFGEISPRQIIATLANEHSLSDKGNESFMRELGWREFAHHLLFHFPYTQSQPLDERFEKFEWVNSAALLKTWQRGATGIPMVDAGMRELWHTGWMHNRVRMIVASFLTKNLRIHWLEGARWFWDTLVDADLANNTLGWQWTAGCGADAAPYFRVFNPVLQAQRFDPDGDYIRRWIPELAHLSNRWLFQPWNAPAAELAKARVELGVNYPQPIVDLSVSRERALEAYSAIKQRSE